MSYKIAIYVIMLIFIVKKFLFVSFECFIKLFFVSCVTLSEKKVSLHCGEQNLPIYGNSIYVMSNSN